MCIPTTLSESAPVLPLRAFASPVSGIERLLDARWQARGPQRPHRPELASWTASELTSWLARREGQRVYTSPVLLGQELPHVARLTVKPGDAAWMEVLPSPLQVPTDTVHDLRTLRIPLVPGPTGTVQVDIPITAVLSENWGDEHERPVLGRFIVTLPETPDPAQLLNVTFRRASAERGEAPVVRGVVDAHQVRRSGWTIHPGGRVEIPVSAQAGELRLYAASDAPGVLELRRDAVRLAGLTVSDTWQSGSWDVRGGTTLTLSNRGKTPIIVGEARVHRAPAELPNVLVYMIDTLRADHVGVYSGDVSHSTPTLDRLASEGAVFARAQSTGSWTKPTVPTLLTGRYPMAHGVGLHGYADVLPTHIPMLHEALATAGWRTGSFSASPLGSTLSGLDRGFDVVVPPIHWRGALGELGHPSAQQVGSVLVNWVDSGPGEPWMAYVHTLEPHAWRNPVFRNPPSGRTSYQQAVTAADDGLAELLSALDARGELDKTLVVVVSDHGESFGQHGVIDHGTSTFQAQTHIPLILWAPAHLSPSVISDTVSLADITPTLLDILGVLPLPDMNGVSLAPYLSAGVPTPIRPGAPSVRLRFVSEPKEPAWLAWTEADGHKVTLHNSEFFLSDVGIDPCEQVLHSGGPEHGTALRLWQIEAQRELQPNTPPSVSSTDTELLRALGYIP
ncbi:MAG: arylsulfatase A-like enzyme [Myxococcota bacterium]